MKLKNNALQELYETIVNGTFTCSPYAASPIDKAFKKCDEKIQSEIDILKRSNEILISANSEAISKRRKLEEEIEGLKEHVLENHKIIADISSERDTLAKERDDLLSRTHCAEDEVKKLNETLEKANADRTELQKDRDSYHGIYTELKKDYDKLFEENKKLKARTDCHRYEVEWYRKHYKEHSDKIKELKNRLNRMCSDEYIKRLQDGVYNGYNQGQTDLWDMLQNVKDMQPNEFDVECECLGDVIDMDLEDFLDAYKKWQEEKEKERIDHMRDYLARFCEGRLCEKCPLGSDEFKCGNGYSFRRRDQFDTRIIPDEELERYYEKARGGGQCTLKDGKLFIHDISHTMAGVNEAIKNACERFTKAVEDTNINISTSAWHGDATAEKIKIEPWSCTLEGTINVEFDRDLLEKVCGVKPEEGAHKLEYGDAVRLVWRDYDYMYIGPDEKEGSLVRMFDPKNHAIVTSHIANVRYNGGKIILTSEDDLRMIWKDTK